MIAALQPIRDNSFLWHVRAGALQSELGSVITADPFSFTFAGESWRTQSWLIELAYQWIDESFGLSGVSMLLAILALTTFIATGISLYRASRSIVSTVLWLTLTAWISAIYLSPRPVIASYALLSIVVLIIDSPRLRWCLVPIGWLWASVHASFLLGIAYVGLQAVRKRRKEHVFDAAAMLGAAMFTAHGLGAIDFLTGFFGNRAALAYLTEWARPNFLSVALFPALLLLIALMHRGSVHMRGDTWIILFGLVLMVSASRSVFPAWLILVPFAAQATAHLESRIPAQAGSVPLLAVISLGVLVVPFLLGLEPRIDEDRFAVDAIAETDPNIPTFHDDVVGGYLIYAEAHERKVFVDDRAELFGADFFDRVQNARAGAPSWQELFSEFEVKQAIVQSESGLRVALEEAGWFNRFEDERWAVFIKP